MTLAARLAAPLLALVFLLAGCGSSPPSKLYVLTADPVPQRTGGSAAGNTVALGRITLPGALALGAIAVLPDALLTGLNLPFRFGGTSILIVVGVALDTLSQIESHLLMRHYEGFVKKGRIRGRRA